MFQKILAKSKNYFDLMYKLWQLKLRFFSRCPYKVLVVNWEQNDDRKISVKKDTDMRKIKKNWTSKNSIFSNLQNYLSNY